VPFRTFLDNGVFQPEKIAVMESTYERVLVALDITDRAHPSTRFIAGTILDLVQGGVTDQAELYEQTLKLFDARAAT
jgi:hypothetical protein